MHDKACQRYRLLNRQLFQSIADLIVNILLSNQYLNCRFINLGGNEKTDIQAMAFKGQIATVQGHPEFNKEIIDQFLEVHAARITDEERVLSHKSLDAESGQGVQVFRLLLQYLEIIE